MKPTFLLGHTLELLTLWNDHYRNHPDPDVSTLSRAQEERLRRVTLRADEQQEMYRSIINTCFEVDIHWSLWHGSSETFWLKMQTYFPGQFSDQSDDPDALAAEVERLSQMHTYNYDLSEEERHDTRGTGLRCAKFAYDAAKYMEDPAAYCAQVGVPCILP
ncbi:uncharacterized protein B0H18DRAFT_1117313 [Fomitopsis serialis]|uniref:uncharacterized protein n=1 Tax=Fomitopsis serialis TaxID=139415 RepID=UPI0020086552|nr:uncharacterized protein B0H18DRAFT_1117313 [Neoantrodia serialis]KAH9929765.1 hypothetical protein B0H18DRAFT_1117313 [Neoantrodia serialis]